MYDNNPYNNNPYNSNNPYNMRSPYGPNAGASGDRLASAAMVMGILALATFVSMTIYPPFIFGAVGIVLALLSKGRSPGLQMKAKAGIICATIGLVANCALCTTSLYMLYTRPEIMEQVNDIFEKQYGMSYDEMLEMILDNGNTPDL